MGSMTMGHLPSRVAVGRTVGQESWECGDCRNVYGPEVRHCPNAIIDTLSALGLVDLSVLKDVVFDSSAKQKPCEDDEWSEDEQGVVRMVADELWKSWFPGITVEMMKERNCYNGEYEIAIEDAKVALSGIRGRSSRR